MRWFFTPSPDDDQTERGEAGHAPGLIGLPDAVLQRHGARVLDPAKAALLNGDEPPLPTAYRARTLLVPGYVLQDFDLRQAAAPYLAALIARALMRGAAAGTTPRLDVPGQQAAADRAAGALRELRREEAELRQEELRGQPDGDG